MGMKKEILGRKGRMRFLPLSLNVDDLESILRQHAPENLGKFRGGKQPTVNKSATQDDEKDCGLKKAYSFKDESFQISSKEDDEVAGRAVQTS